MVISFRPMISGPVDIARMAEVFSQSERMITIC